jgi:hypothetical protein
MPTLLKPRLVRQDTVESLYGVPASPLELKERVGVLGLTHPTP